MGLGGEEFHGSAHEPGQAAARQDASTSQPEDQGSPLCPTGNPRQLLPVWAVMRPLSGDWEETGESLGLLNRWPPSSSQYFVDLKQLLGCVFVQAAVAKTSGWVAAWEGALGSDICAPYR